MSNNILELRHLNRKSSSFTKEEKDLYSFYVNNTSRNKEVFKYKNNTITTTKYNVITFLPKALFYQFMRLANVYFLFTAILNCIKIISPLASGIALVPIIFVLCVSLVRELIEDIYRAKLDRKQNNEITEVYDNSTQSFKKIQTGKLEVGEIVRVKQDQTFPADLILIDSNLEEGLCFIETASLDGEKSLKIKQASMSTQGIIKEDCKIEKFTGYASCDKPNPFLYHLIGKIRVTINNSNVETPLNAKQLLLKGAQLRNTQYIIGIVLYSGNECKIMKNSKKPRMKYSKVETLMNKMLIAIFISQTLLCVLSAILHKVYYVKYLEDNPYLNKMDVKNIDIDSVVNYFSYILLYNTMIPISLIITMEIVKGIQAVFLWLDAEGYSLIRKKNIQPHSINLNEELGMVNYIFTDKTGTLTCNKMEFKYCVIGDVCYEYAPKHKRDTIGNNNNINYETNTNANNTPAFGTINEIVKFADNEMREISNGNKVNTSQYPNVNIGPNSQSISTAKVEKYINSKGSGSSFSNNLVLNNSFKIIDEYWKALSLCHDCSIDDNGYYIGLSPDSIELVRAAKMQGYKYIKNPHNKTSIRRIQFGENERNFKDFEKLQLFEFTSDRKRESIIVKEDNCVKMYIKGADNVIEKRLSTNNPSIFLNQAKKFVNHFSSMGYRTLFVGMKVFTNEEYEKVANELNDANMDMNNKETKLNELYDKIENELYLLGATIVEDKLQDKVPETIRDLKLAGIKLWMLTGDKMSTAFNISLSCNLISKTMKTFFIEGKEIKRNEKLEITNVEEIEEVIISFAKKFNKFRGEKEKASDLPSFGILIDEKALLTLCNNESMRNIFLNIAKDAASVICCRVSPLQKSQVVKMIKDYSPDKITLAIGDGGNDVSMIMEAHIGIGIYGEEGMRAVQSSDYAIGEFKILRQLTLFHGRVNLIRISDMILFFFYKNFIFTIVHFFYAFYCNFSAQTIIDDWFINMYNLLLTAFPLGARACIDFDVKPDDGIIINQLLPFLYAETRDHPIFTPVSFVLHIIKGIVHGVINFFFFVYFIDDEAINSDGDIGDLWYASVTIYTNIILIVSFDLAINTKYHTWLNAAVMGILTFLAYGLFLIIVHYGKWFNSRATMAVTFGSANFYLSLLFVSGTCVVLDIILIGLKTNFSQRMSSYLERLVNTHGKIDDTKDIKNQKIRNKLSIYNDYKEIEENNNDNIENLMESVRNVNEEEAERRDSSNYQIILNQEVRRKSSPSVN